MKYTHQTTTSIVSDKTAATFNVNYHSVDKFPAADDDKIMALITFGTTTATDTTDSHHFTVGLPELGNHHIETWISQEPVMTGKTTEFSFSYNQQVLFAQLCLEESQFSSLETTTYYAYQAILNFIKEINYNYLLRVWNYFPHINQERHGIERYQAFCAGRYEALQTIPTFERLLPAATVIGTQSPGVLIYFLAAKSAGVQVENPRQVSAFRYPRRYGDKSPSFSRAILKSWENTEQHLYISGTASIVGHATQHEQNTKKQLTETIHNLEVLLENANQQSDLTIQSLDKLSLLKVYIRHETDFMLVKQQLNQVIKHVPIIYLQGDICRRDLLVEIEGMGCTEINNNLE